MRSSWRGGDRTGGPRGSLDVRLWSPLGLESTLPPHLGLGICSGWARGVEGCGQTVPATLGRGRLCLGEGFNTLRCPQVLALSSAGHKLPRG